MLNELTPGLEGRVAPTDCRLRPDQHCLEQGQYDQVGRMQGGRGGGPKTDGRCKDQGRLAPRGGVARRSPWLRSRALLWAPAAPACLLPPPPPTLPPRARRQANAEKQRLEHKQRAARKAADRGDPIRPRWCASCGPRGLQPRAAAHGGCSCAEAATGKLLCCCALPRHVRRNLRLPTRHSPIPTPPRQV